MWRLVSLPRWSSMSVYTLLSRFNGVRIVSRNMRDVFLAHGSRLVKNTLATVTPGLVFAWPFKGMTLDANERAQFVIVELFTEAKDAIQAHDFPEADRILHKLLHHLHTAHVNGVLDSHEYMNRRVRVYSDLANVQLMCRKHQEAEKLLTQIIRDCHALGVPLDALMVVELSLKLALVYEHMGRLDEAALGFSYCVSTLEQKLARPITDSDELANVHALLGMSNNYYSKFLYKTGSLESALEHAKRALELARLLYQPDHPNCLHLSSDIALILIGLGLFSEARTVLDQINTLIERAQVTPSSETSEDDLLSCLAHASLQRVVLEVNQGHIEIAKELVAQVETILRRIKTQSEIRDYLNHIREQYNLKS